MFQGRNASCNSLLRCFFFDNDGYNVMTLLTVPEKEPVITPPSLTKSNVSLRDPRWREKKKEKKMIQSDGCGMPSGHTE